MTAYALAKQSDGRISLSTSYRLCRMNGRLESFEAAALEALCDVLGVTPGELFERDGVKAVRSAQTATSSAKRRSTSDKRRRGAR